MSAIISCVIYVLFKVAVRKKKGTFVIGTGIKIIIIKLLVFFINIMWIKYIELNWGSSRQSQQIKTVIRNAYKANTIQYHVKNCLLNIMVLSGNPQSRKKLVSLAHLITKNNNGLQMCIYAEKVFYGIIIY